MNILKKKQSMLIAILISLILMVGAFFGTFFALKPGRVEAQEYNYGNFNPTGYYELDGVVFYAVKVKEVNGTQTYASISEESSFILNGIEYTIDNSETPASLSYTIGTQTLTIPIEQEQFFTINGLNYAFDLKANPTKVLRVVESASISGNAFTLGGVEYTINFDEANPASPTELTYKEGSETKTINILTRTSNPASNFTISFQINGVDYIFDEITNPTKVYRVLYNYWPTYEMTTTNGKPDFVKFGDTVLLKPDESIMLCFARQTESAQADNGYIIKDGQKLSTSVDLLTGYLEINGISKTNANINTTVGGIQKQEFGYIINLNNKAIIGKNQNALLGIADGTEGGVNNEGLIEFTANYEIGSSQRKEYSFMFYAFKEETYQREEKINTNPTERFFRPNPAIRTSDSTLLEHVTDSATANQFFSEAFYYYENQNLPYLEYDYTRYEINILKTIHNNTITYNLTYGIIDVQTNEKGIIVEKGQNLSTIDVYARDLRIEEIEGTTRVRIYFEDLGVYDFLYKAVYYGTDGQKVELEIPGLDTLKDRMTIYGTQATYQDINKGRSSFRSDDNLISADVTGKGTSLTKREIDIDDTARTFTILGVSYTIDSLENPKIITDDTDKTISVNNNKFTIGNNEYLIFNEDGSYILIYYEVTTPPNNFEIASTNQPQVSLLFNSTVTTSGDNTFKVYYSSTLNGNFLADTSYTYTSNFTTPGYYYVVVTNQYSQYKIWLGNSTQYSSSTPKTQVYFFQIKDQTPDLGIYQLKDNGEVPNITTATRVYSGSYYNGNYIGSYTKNGVQIYEAKATSIFDSPVVLSVQFREFNQTQLTTINLPAESVSKLTPQQISYLASYGVTKYDGYYTFTKNGHYSVRLNFGKSGSTSCLFDIDTEAISGIKVYNTDYLEGSLYYNSTLLAEQGTFATTKDAIALLWNQKASGAKITAKYVRFDMINNNYKTTKNYGQYGQDDDNIYKINDTWLAADYAIVLSETNPETIYNEASNPSSITSSSVLTLDGLYIFRLQDEAGNVAFYSVLVDTSIPTVLQKPENGVMYKKITGINNVSENTEVFFGSHKAIAFMFGTKLANPTLEGAGSLSEALLNTNNAKFAEYFNALFENLSTMGASNILKQDTEFNYFATVPIRKVTFKVVDGSVTDLPQSNINQGYHILVPLRNDPKAGQETGRIADKTYIYQIYDASNKSNKNPTRAYSVRVNTDQTGVTVYYKKENEKIAISHNSSSTAEDLLSITNYYKPVGKNVNELYLTWSNLHFEETMGAYVDLLNSGLVCYFYELTWDAAKNSFKYSETGTLIPLDFSNINDAKERNGESVEISINLSLGRTVAGKYEIIRKYSYTESGLASNLGDDYETVVTTFFVDRTDIISSPSTNGTQNGYYTFMTLFDGGSQANKIFYNSLYQQSQNSNSYVVQTNELPIGFYIPVSKYGTFYKVESETNITKTDIQSGNFAYQYENLVEFGNLDVSQSAGVTNTVYSPYTLRVILESPSAVKNPKTGLYYHYTYNANGYFMLSGYSVGEGNIITITDRKAFIAKNPITNATEWETGTYRLTIRAIEQDDNSYLQNFKFLFNVTAKTPAYDLDAEYPELENIDSRKLVVGDSNYYYTNANQILVKWEESINNFLTKIDITKVHYTYTAGNATITKYAGTDFNIVSTGNSRSFKINLPNNVLDGSRVTITMIYETYSTDTENYYQKYYPGGLYQSSRTITIDREAPVDSINNLVNTDETVKGVNPQLLRASSDSRFNKSITTGIYKYYSFMPSTTFISDLASSLKINSSTQTNYFYYRYFPDKYATSIIYETGLGLDPTAQANNLFSEYYALNNNWKKVDKDTIVDEAYINNNFPLEGYYELIEFDLAGNMTIYTIYLTSGKDLNIDFSQKLSVEESSGSLEIKKVEEGFKVTLTQLETSSDSINSGIISINSFDTFNFKNLDFGTYSYIYNTVTYNNSYKYMRIKIDNVDYIVTPFGYENVTKGNDTKLSCTKINRRDASGTLVSLNEIKLTASTTAHTVQLYDTVNKKTHTLSIKVANSNTRITDNGGVNIVSDSQSLSALIGLTSFNKTIALIIREQTNAALKFAPDSLRIYEINESFTNGYKLHIPNIPISETSSFSAGYTTTYYYLPYESSFDTSTFYFAFKDDFGNEYFDYVEYSSINFDRYEYTGNDLTSDMQTNDEILVSRDIIVNFSNLFTTNITARINDNVNFVDATSYYTKMATPEGAYKQFNLKALDILANGYYGGLIEFKIDLVSNIPSGIIDELTNSDNKFTSISNTNNIIKTIRVKIYNQLPQLSITTNDGSDITNNLLNEEITQSEPITISFNSESNLSDSLGINAKVFIRLRGSAAGYYEITSPTTISEAGIYDIYIQNFDSKGALDFVQSYDFVISNLDVIFYTVVKTNSEGNQEIISPTGRVFKYLSQGITRYVPYHYIVNTDSYEVKTNGEKVKASTPYFDSASNTYIYTISSTASSGVVFNTTIAVTIIPATNNILGSNSFTWYYGTTYTSPSPESYIKSNIKDIFLTQEDGYDEVTLRWDSFYSSPYNKITCYVSSDDGQSWSVVTGISDGDLTTLTLKKSSNYLFKFVDYAGNTQTFTSVSGYPSTTTRVTFIRSVIYKLNENNPLDNSIYNGTVTISLPANMASYYSSIPTLVVMKNNAEYEPLKNDIGNYEFTEAGTYVIYFAVKVKNGTKNLNEDKLTFTIINENDSRWAFNYVNYNNYTVNYIRYNGVSISPALRAYAFNGNEINISAFLEDSLGNKYFNNGIYTIKITSIDDAMGSQSFEFNFWLNDATPPVTVSLAEGTTTTNSIKVSFNEANLYETIGDCYVMINNTIISEIDSSSAELQEISLTNVRSYYIQVYTNSGKLAYSYRVEITEPLNTITIILIAVSSTVVVVGLLLFFLLRKRMKIR